MRAVLVAVLFAAACGDNNLFCGDGTRYRDGTCVLASTDAAPVACGSGTTLDPATNACVPADGTCAGGTILVGGECRDPDAAIAVDLEEGPEPNGLGDPMPAGILSLVTDAHGFVIHGCIAPAGGAADLDAYRLAVTGPTLLTVTVAGVDGLVGGFLVRPGGIAGLESWQRFGVTASGATAQREVYLPAAGTYTLAITDTRSLWSALDGGGTDALPPAGDGTTCYYATVREETIAPEPLSLQNSGVAASGTLGSHVHLYTTTQREGLYRLTNRVTSTHAAAALAVQSNARFVSVAGALDSPPTLAFGGATGTETNLTIVADTVWSYDLADAPFQLVADYAVPAQPLASASSGATLAGTTADLQAFSIGTKAGDIAVLLDLAFSVPVQGAILDGSGQTYADFGGLDVLAGDAGTYHTWTTFRGTWLRPPDQPPGGYYLVLRTPRTPAGTPYTLEYDDGGSPIVGALALGTPSSFYLSHLFAWVYDPTDQPCVIFASDAPVTLSLYPVTALGRIGALAETTGPPTNPAVLVDDPTATPPFATVRSSDAIDVTALPTPFYFAVPAGSAVTPTACEL